MSSRANEDASPRHIFTYGTLEVPEVLEAVTGRSFETRAARLDGFRRYQVSGVVYPGIIAATGHSTPGHVYLELDPDTLQVLDHFEGDLYERRSLDVVLDAGETLRAETYVVRAEKHARLTREPWDPELFRDRHLADYLVACRRFHASLRPRR